MVVGSNMFLSIHTEYCSRDPELGRINIQKEQNFYLVNRLKLNVLKSRVKFLSNIEQIIIEVCYQQQS